MHRNTRPRSIGRWPWCAMCGGNFRSIGYPFGRAEFCTKRCLDRYLADRAGPRLAPIGAGYQQRQQKGCATIHRE